MPDPVTPLPVANPPVSDFAAKLDALFPTGVIPQTPTAPVVQPPVVAPVVPPVVPVTPPPVPDPNAVPVDPKAKEAADKAAVEKLEADIAAADKKDKDTKTLTKEELDRAQAAMTVPAGTAFKIVRADLATEKELRIAAETKAAELERKSGELTVDSKELIELREKIKDYQTTLAVVDVQSTDQFKKTISKPIADAQAELNALAVKHQISEGDLRAALAEPDANKRSDKLSELSATFNRLDTAKFDRLILDLGKLENDRTRALDSAAAQLQSSKEEREREATSARVNFDKDFKASRDRALADLKADKTVTGIIFSETGDPEFDADMAKSVETAGKLDITRMSNEQLAKRLYMSEALPFALRLVANQNNRVTELETENTKLRGSTPPAGGGDLPPPVNPSAVPANASFLDVAREKLKGVLPG